jgi:hypothetical protein
MSPHRLDLRKGTLMSLGTDWISAGETLMSRGTDWMAGGEH